MTKVWIGTCIQRYFPMLFTCEMNGQCIICFFFWSGELWIYHLLTISRYGFLYLQTKLIDALGFLGLGINAHVRLLFNHEVNQEKKITEIKIYWLPVRMEEEKWTGIEWEEKNKLPVSGCGGERGRAGVWYIFGYESEVCVWLAYKSHTQTGSFICRYLGFWRGS